MNQESKLKKNLLVSMISVMTSYLDERYVRVSNEKIVKKLFLISSAVPEGSIMSQSLHHKLVLVLCSIPHTQCNTMILADPEPVETSILL